MKSSLKRSRPDLSLENRYDGIVCGLDEAGRAPLAGPVTAACVYIPEDTRRKRFWSQVADSKILSPEIRAELYEQIVEHACFGIAHAEVSEIDDINIHHASYLAMKRAYEEMRAAFSLMPVMALVDGKFLPQLPCAMTPVIKGDGISRSIAAASILAKVTRDRLMAKLHEAFPVYGWDTNAGYPTPAHKAAIEEHGVTIHHRRSFAPIRQYALSS